MKSSLVSGATLLALVSPALVSAQENFQSLTGLPVFDTLGSGPAGLSGFFNQLYVLAVGAAAIIAVAQIMISGFRLATAGGNHSTIEEARDSIQNTILGLLLVLSPTIVFGIINPKILNLEINTAILDRPKVTEDGTYVQDPLVKEAAANLTRNEFGELKDVCQIDFSGDKTDRVVSVSYLGKGTDATGRACCRLMDGTFDSQDPNLCRLDNLIDNDRYALASKVIVLVPGTEVRSGAVQDVEKEAIIWSAGANPSAGITIDLWIAGFTAKWRDNALFAIHGFRDKKECEAVAKSLPALERLLRSQPLGAGLVRVNETTLLGQSLADPIPASQVKKVMSVSTSYCEKVEYNQK